MNLIFFFSSLCSGHSFSHLLIYFFPLFKVLFKNSWSALRCSQPPGEYETANWSALADILSSAKQASNKIKSNIKQQAEIMGYVERRAAVPVLAGG